MPDTMPRLPALAARSARLRDLMSLLLVAMTVLLLLERFSAAALALYRDADAQAVRRLAAQFIAAGPELLYLLALWWVRQALDGFSRGALFAPAIARALERVGIVLVAGALINTLVVPGAQTMLGFGPGYLIAYDVGGLVLGAVGLSLSILAHVLRYAAAMQAELDEIF